jgi:hypothetical protein
MVILVGRGKWAADDVALQKVWLRLVADVLAQAGFTRHRRAVRRHQKTVMPQPIRRGKRECQRLRATITGLREI